MGVASSAAFDFDPARREERRMGVAARAAFDVIPARTAREGDQTPRQALTASGTSQLAPSSVQARTMSRIDRIPASSPPWTTTR